MQAAHIVFHRREFQAEEGGPPWNEDADASVWLVFVLVTKAPGRVLSGGAKGTEAKGRERVKRKSWSESRVIPL